MGRWTERTKRSVDILGALVGLVAIAPVLVVISLLIALSGRSPIFVHRRLGMSGTPFPCLKFQTMHGDSEDRLLRLLASSEQAKREWAADQKLTKDPRITRLGRFLRRTNLDELPQLVNVLLGHMSLVGPRPIVTAERDRYGSAYPAVASVRPGLTGLWQVSGRNALSYERRVELDIDYVTSCSISTDLWIILRTIGQTLLALIGFQRFGGV